MSDRAMEAPRPAGELSSVSVVLERGGIAESVHRVHWALADARGALLEGGGEPERTTFLRSAAKPFQALPLVEDGAVERWGIPPAELALCCASHSGEEAHVAGVRRLLGRVGLEEGALACGPHDPLGEDAARVLRASGLPSLPVHNNCSGKHAGMLALARHRGWETEGYHLPGHPVQRRLLAEVARWTGVAEKAVPTGVDGCGVVCFAVPLRAAAAAFARLAEADRKGEEGPEAVLSAMTAHPFEVAGTGRLCTELMEATAGRIAAKVGAEGVYCAADRSRGLGLALKVEDGARRAADVALVALLESLGLLRAPELTALDGWRERAVANTRGEPAARLRAEGGVRRDGSRDDGLSPELRALVRVSGAVASRDAGALERELAAARGSLADETGLRALEEALVQSYLFAGFPAALNALGSWRRLAGGGAPGGEALDADEAQRHLARGEELCRRIYGRQYPALRRNIARLHPDMDRWMIQEGYGKVLARPGLGLQERELCIVALLAVQGAWVQLYSHLRGALAVGALPERVEGALVAVGDLVPPEARAAMWETWERVRRRREERDDGGEEI
jgi:L-asparaginase II/alkylhydroperoxidase/carboxymuconolactone decarboxylase family protein YurZ